jgi:DNA-binding NarL/FixJ family response regulator
MTERPHPLKVFLAEDCVPVRERVAAMLSAHDMNIVGQAATPEASIDGILAARPDVVVLDARLEGGTGLQVLRSVREREPGIGFVVFSNSAASAYRQHYLRHGARRFLDKAADVDQLVTAVEESSRHAEARA